MNSVIIGLHVTGGCLGLAALLPPLASKKGGRLHRQSGWVFTAGMAVTGLTGLGISGGFLAAGRLNTGVFFAVVSVLLLEGLWTALAALRRKRNPDRPGRRIDLILPAALALAGAMGTARGLSTRDGLLIGFSVLSVANGGQSLRFVWRPLSSPMAWWYQHMDSMMGASIAAITAFLVLNSQKFLTLPDTLRWIPWVVPSLIIVPLFMLWVRRYKVRFGELNAS